MNSKVVFAVVACVFQITAAQMFNNIGPRPCFSNQPICNGFSSNLNAGNQATVPSGYGDMVIVGELPVGGNTCVQGQVPVIGYVNFEGTVPAGGMVSVANNNNCGCK